ncbi:hypothetical protein CRYUN_Cryun07bG0008000 [Craigia yunnanensis]
MKYSMNNHKFVLNCRHSKSEPLHFCLQAMARYARREVSCLSLTDKEAMFSGNFMFTSLENSSPDSVRR